MRIALFVTCLTDTLFPDTGKAVVTLLERLGHQVEFPPGQTCCGQMHFNTGYRRESLPLARSFADSFTGYDAVASSRPKRGTPGWPGRWPTWHPGCTTCPRCWSTCSA
jgi:Fe-S oxidoreductase